MTVLFDNLFGEILDVLQHGPVELYQAEIEALTAEEYAFFLAHGSLDADREVY